MRSNQGWGIIMNKVKVFLALCMLVFISSTIYALNPHQHHIENGLILHFFPKKITANEKKKLTSNVRNYCSSLRYGSIDACLRQELKKMYAYARNKKVEVKNYCFNISNYLFDDKVGTCQRQADK